MNKKVRLILTVLLAAVFAVSIVMVVSKKIESSRQSAATDEAIELVSLPDFDALFDLPADPTVAPTADASSDTPAASSAPQKTPPPAETLTPEQREQMYISALESIDLAAIRELNSDVIGWLVIPGTRVSYPILRGSDNDYYLKHNWKKERNSAGSVYVDYRVDSPFVGDFNTVVYGHNMNDGQMFAELKSYKSADFAAVHPKVYVALETGVVVYDIYAAWEAPVEPYYGSPYTVESDIEGAADDSRDAEKFAVMNEGVRRSAVKFDALSDVRKDSQILTLSTCVAEGRGYSTRWVVQAVREVKGVPMDDMVGG